MQHGFSGYFDSKNLSEEKTAPLWAGSISQTCYVSYLTLWNSFCRSNVCDFIQLVNGGQNPLSDRTWCGRTEVFQKVCANL